MAQSYKVESQNPIDWAFKKFNSGRFHTIPVRCSVQDLSKTIRKRIKSAALSDESGMKTLKPIEFISEVQRHSRTQISIENEALVNDKVDSRLKAKLQTSLLSFPDLRNTPVKEKENKNCQSQKEFDGTEETLDAKKYLELNFQIFPDKQSKPNGFLELNKVDTNSQVNFLLSSESKIKTTRWNKNKDKELFATIRTLENQGVIKLNDILQMNSEDGLIKQQGVAILAEKIQWKFKHKSLIHRIKKLSNMKFTCREIQNLKRIIKKEYKNKNLNYEKILYHFPGKTVENLIETCNRIFDCINNFTLSNFPNES